MSNETGSDYNFTSANLNIISGQLGLSPLSVSEIREQETIRTKQCRVEIDAVLQNVKKLITTREVDLCITKLQEAVMWLGMNLKQLGENSPYPNSYQPENTIIDPTADNLKL